MFIRTEPQLFLEMLRLRVGLIIQVNLKEKHTNIVSRLRVLIAIESENSWMIYSRLKKFNSFALLGSLLILYYITHSPVDFPKAKLELMNQTGTQHFLLS